jgi:preprotein translocase subunit SecA
MLQVLDEKWKDHLYDLDQLRNTITYRGWGQKDPLIEYKEEAYTMFVDLMHDIYSTFTERFLRAQIVFTPPQARASAPPPTNAGGPSGARGGNGADGASRRPTKRYNALGILEDVPPEEPVTSDKVDAGDGGGDAEAAVTDIGPTEPPGSRPAARPEPTLVGAGGRSRSLGRPPAAAAATDWSSVGRNDPCPCGSGKKFKKCHGAV